MWWQAQPAAKVVSEADRKKRRRNNQSPDYSTPRRQRSSRDRWWNSENKDPEKGRWWNSENKDPEKGRWWADSERRVSPEEEEMEYRRIVPLKKQDAEFAEENQRNAKHNQREAAEILREEHKDVRRAEAKVRRDKADVKRDKARLREQFAAFRVEKERLEDEKASIREEKRNLRLARERLREYSERVRETIDRAVDYVGGYHEEDEELPTKQLWIRRILFIFTGFPLIALYIVVLTGCMANNIISRAFYTINVFSGASDEFIVPNLRVGYFGICAIMPSTGKDICTPNFPYGRSATSAAAIVQSALFQGSTDTSTATNIELAVGIQQKLLPLTLMPFFAFTIGLLWTIWVLPTSKMASAILQWSAGNMMSAAGSISTAGGAIQLVTSRSTGHQISRGVPLQIGQYLIALGCLGFAALVGYIDKRGRRKAHEGFKMQFQVQEFKV